MPRSVQNPIRGLRPKQVYWGLRGPVGAGRGLREQVGAGWGRFIRIQGVERGRYLGVNYLVCSCIPNT